VYLVSIPAVVNTTVWIRIKWVKFRFKLKLFPRCCYGTIDNTMEIDQAARKGSYVDDLEICYLYNAVKTGIDLN